MKLLVDECLPVDFRLLITGHSVFTVEYCGWKGTKNGRLLARAVADGFEAMVTSDAGIEREQNRASLPIPVIILHPHSNDMADLRPLVPSVLKALANLSTPDFVHIYY